MKEITITIDNPEIKTKIAATISDQDYQALSGEQEFKENDNYWYVRADGVVHYECWVNNNIDNDRLNMGNAFHTRGEAKDHKLRIESLSKGTAVKGEDFYVWCFKVEGVEAIPHHLWGGYIIEPKFKINSECSEWGKKYAQCWLNKK